MRVDLYPDLLTVPNDLIASKDITLLDLLDNEYGSGDGTWVIWGNCWDECLVNAKSLGAQISNEVALEFLVGYQHRISISQEIVSSSETPGDLLAWLCDLGKCLVELKSALIFLVIVILAPKESNDDKFQPLWKSN